MPDLIMEIAGSVFTSQEVDYDGCHTPLARQERQEKVARGLRQQYAREIYRCGGRATFYIKHVAAFKTVRDLELI